MEPNIAAFLSARLDEAEAQRNNIHRLPCGSVDRDGEFDPDPIWCSCGYPDLMRKDIEAKRAILDSCIANGASTYPAPWENDPPAARMGRKIIGQLAAVYSDHPDFNQARQL